MKITTIHEFLVLFIFLIITSCSSDDSGGVSGDISGEDRFDVTYDNEQINIVSATAIRSENTFQAILTADDDRSFGLIFNAFGDLIEAQFFHSSDFDFPDTVNFYYNSSHYLDFELLGINEDTQRFEFIISGQLFEDEYNSNSDSHTISANVNVSYSFVQPQIEGLYFMANINGEEWHGNVGINGGGLDNSFNTFYNEDGTHFTFYYPGNSLVEGQYNFDSNSAVRIEYSIYDPIANQFIDYETSGTLTIEEVQGNSLLTLSSGTFSFTTSNPEVVNVTDGQFLDIF